MQGVIFKDRNIPRSIICIDRSIVCFLFYWVPQSVSEVCGRRKFASKSRHKMEQKYNSGFNGIMGGN